MDRKKMARPAGFEPATLGLEGRAKRKHFIADLGKTGSAFFFVWQSVVANNRVSRKTLHEQAQAGSRLWPFGSSRSSCGRPDRPRIGRVTQE